MATLQVRLQDLATRIATECKAIRTAVNGNALDNSALLTEAKTNLVAAINELHTDIEQLAAAAGATINDASSASTTQTWSVTKLVAEFAETSTAISDAVAASKAEILGGAGAAYDTLAELKTLLDTEAGGLTTALGLRVRVDVNNQGLTTQQKQNARTNIDAYGVTELGNPDTNLVTTFEAGLT
jgi:hypothetical protein